MSTKAAHTSTPWRLVVEGDGEDEMIIRTVLGPAKDAPRNLNEICLFTTGSFSDENEAANAEFAITAVNHHQELLTRLYNLCNEIERDFPLTCNMIASYVEARETLKKLEE